jgi:flagellar biosynthesis protein
MSAVRGYGPRSARRIAVALEYDGSAAPRVTAKGQGEIAEKIIETARKHDVPLEENPLLAQALAAVEIDDHIPEELYKAVAQVIGFVLRLRAVKQSGER